MTSYQVNRYEKLRIGILKKINRIESNVPISPLFVKEEGKGIEEFESLILNPILPKFLNCSLFYLDYWLVGFLNGEVSFTTFKGKAGNLKPKVSLEHTNELALNFFKSHLELGPKVYKLKQRKNRQITYRIDITSVADLEKICLFLNRTDCLLGNKYTQFQNWKIKYFSSYINNNIKEDGEIISN